MKPSLRLLLSDGNSHTQPKHGHWSGNQTGLDVKRGYRSLMLATVTLVTIAGIWVVGRALAQTGEPAEAVLTVQAPAQVAVGEVIELRLRLDGADAQSAIGGFEAELLYDPAQAEWADFTPAGPHGDASVGRLTAPVLPNGSAFGFYTCTTAPCLARRSVEVAAEPGVLARVDLLAVRPGQLEIGLEHVQLVDALGRPRAFRLAAARIVVQVGDEATLHGAPASTWRAAASVAAAAVDVAAADVTDDGAVTHGDLMEIALAWESARAAGDACAGGEADGDVNGDGCVDIRDVQAVAAQTGEQSVGGASAQPGLTPRLFLPLMILPTTEGSSDVVRGTEATATFVVNSTLDEADATVDDGLCLTASGVCTLRAAIRQSVAHNGPDVITFAIPGDGVHTIQLTRRLQALSDANGGTTIDGYTQPGASPNTDGVVSNAKLMIQVRGNGANEFDALPITSAGNVIKGLSFFNFKRALWIYGVGAHDNVVVGNFIGTDAAGAFRIPSVSDDGAHGIHIEQGAYNNRIGGVPLAERNVISGNGRNGVGLWHLGTDSNLIVNNLIGLSPDGLRNLPNQGHGVDFNYAASRNIVGGTASNERNVLSGNIENGAEISHGSSTTDNRIVGNFIGTDVSGNAGPSFAANLGYGISIHDRVINNLISGNVIGNNRKGGVEFDEFGACCMSGNVLEGNRIGIGIDGGVIGNLVAGVRIVGSRSRIGPDNIIAYNPVGIQVEGETSDRNTFTENSIFGNTGLGIDLAPLGQVNANDPGDADTGANQQLNFPVLESASLTEVSGTACAGCRVELFVADEAVFQPGEGKTFAGAAIAELDGTFTVQAVGLVYGNYLTATATDGEGNTSEFSENILLAAPTNNPPQAVDDTATTFQAAPVTIDVLANDTDPEDDPLFVVGVGVATNGIVSAVSSYVVYTPNPGFLGEDSFTYIVSDNLGGSSTGTVTVTTTIATGPQVIIVPATVQVTEEGVTDTYTAVLAHQPLAAVTLSVIADATQVAVDHERLTFTTQNWDTPQTITVTAKDDGVTEGAHESIIYHNSTSADSSFHNIGVQNVAVEITEIDPNAPAVVFPVLMNSE